MRIVVTGGAGFVGSACLRYLLGHGHDAIAYDNLSQGHRAAAPADRLIVGDISQTENLAAVLRKHRAEAVMHFAAATYVGESVDNPDFHYGNNVGGTRSILNAMRMAGVPRMLFSSTCAVYGVTPRFPMNEESPVDPISPYARTKLATEWMIRDFAHAYGLGFTILRYFNAAGASPDGSFGEDHRPENHLIPLVLQVALGQRDRIMVFGGDYPTEDGTCIRDYIHVDDLASAHLLAIETTTPGNPRVFNVGTGRGHSVLETIRVAEEVTGRSIAREVAPRRPGDPPRLVADPIRLTSQLGWAPRYRDIRETIATAWRWHSGHPHGYSEAAAS